MNVCRWCAKRWVCREWLLAFALILVTLYPAASRAQNITYGELKFGIWAHDPTFAGGRESGADINPEVIFASPVTNDMVASVPGSNWLWWALQPRPTIGASINTDGNTDQFYAGATWSWMLFQNVINPGDGINFSFFFGPGGNDGQIHNGNATRKALGSHILFREAFELGYQINPTWEISAYFDHISNGGLAKENQSINDLGARIGFRF
ncbi:MAG TPA: acyloxyacyl hydrolase [Stellaceae bacterium]|nr:acyloxyacyl hydrolase [Stellaceae bacterium]